MTIDPIRPLALITGASSGIGRALAQVFASNGFDLVVTAEDSEGLGEVARELGGTPGGARVTTVAVNLLDPDGVETLWQAVAEQGRPIDVLAANAGIGTGGPFAETSLAAELKTIGLNVVATTHLLKLVVEDMVRRGEGRVLITGSIAGLGPAPFQAVYGATKAYLNALGESIREELRDSGVGITVLMPGFTDTEFFERAGMDKSRIPPGSMGEPIEVAEAGFRAVMADRDKIVPGLVNKVVATMARLIPDPLLAKATRVPSERITGEND